MNSGDFQKAILYFFLLINLGSSSEAGVFTKLSDKRYPSNVDINWSNFSKSTNNNSKVISTINKDKFGYFTNQKFQDADVRLVLANLSNNKGEFVIESEIQSEENNILFAERNVSVSYKGKILRADKLTYDKSQKIISAFGNITLVFGDQIFKMSQLEYNLKDETGYLLDVKGTINSDNLITDISKNFNDSDIEKINHLLNLQKKEVLNTPNKVNNWIFSTKKIIIDGNKWKSKKAIFSNDLLQFKQVKIVINSLEAFSLKKELRFRSSLNYLVLDENVSIPFWLGNRALTKSGQNFDSKSSWTISYDNLDKDGLFIGRKFKSMNLGDDFIIDFEPQFFIQRSLKGHTKSFVKKGDLITSEKVKRDTHMSDYFGFESKLKGKINSWNIEIDNQINSLDTNKFSDALRFKSILNKEINFLNAKWDKSFYGVYRDRVWNGSLGEAEIYLGYGSQLEKKHTWEVNGTTNTEVFSFGLAHLKGEQLSSKNLVDSFKGNLFYSLDKNTPLSIDKPKNKIIDTSYEYIYEPINKGLSLNTRIASLYSFYDNGKHQEYIGFGLGPELILGDFKAKTFDYTRISIFPFYKFKSGESVFKFDQISDKFTLNIGFDQQIFGPIILKSNGTLNLDGNSDDYGEFIDSKISVNWKKRSYEFGIFYQPHNQSGGISFSLYGFK
ncbi:Repeats containing protein [Prochlorococcus marinus str. MIT 9321]|uniref:Repeats containing protein n=1 Tax=Prochlorococcus marinus str. MIT 9401 TaxID=167551 RepID=A0A0A2B8C2_PROMR|nr:DUF3769 domain-containing protein [Prochlorococcus marinus]KGG03842.1 Repeats containing protein [Prochlorococcus marinus str. MIT 9321]KGG06340.1 Repeats containing protein [Prochlorococcus marinus str. MIT 9322]KGG10101.1 Repeats containing protein [Prochlorococcus marinus str. MIT 9401]